MKDDTAAPRARVLRGRAPIGIGIVIVMLMAFTAPVGAQIAETTVTVSGNSKPSACNGARGVGAIFLTGDLRGCLIFFPTAFTCEELNGFDRYRESGRELFIGKMNGERGRFRTTYTLDATYAPGFCAAVDGGEFPFDMQLTGGCDHRVRGKTGAFAGMRGLITFFDVIPDPGKSGASNFLYSGELHLT